jgi:hypothetical protein
VGLSQPPSHDTVPVLKTVHYLIKVLKQNYIKTLPLTVAESHSSISPEGNGYIPYVCTAYIVQRTFAKYKT